MSDAYSIAASGLQSEQYAIAAIANDLANSNTSSYKATRLRFADAVYHALTDSGVSGERRAISMGDGVAVVQSSKDFSSGALLAADFNHVAISGAGFYRVLLDDGRVAYTRNANLTVDKQGYLAVDGKYRLCDDIQIPLDAEYRITEQGHVLIKSSGSTLPDDIGTIRLARFYDPALLNPMGQGIYQASEQTGEPNVNEPGQSHILGHLKQGYREASNVDLTTTLVQLTQAQRIYQMNARALQVANDLDKMMEDIRG